jgi:hypothetical protein
MPILLTRGCRMFPSPRRVGAIAPSVQIVRFAGAARLVATAAHATGSTILALEGALSDRPTRYSIQIGVGLHLLPFEGLEPDDVRCPWRFLNHGCRPNAAFCGHRLVAIRSTAPEEEITFHYATTEWEMAEPFACRCPACEPAPRTIAGFRALGEAERRALWPFAAAHLRELARGWEAGASTERADR